MSSHLRPCSSCARHVRQSESACPFCGAELAAYVDTRQRNDAVTTGRLMRAAIVFATAASTAAIASCGGKEAPVPDGTSTSSGASGTSGGTSGTSGTSGGTSGTSGTSGGTSGTSGTSGALPPYGVPPIDAGDDRDATRDGGPAPLYGPPPFDP